MSKYHQILKTTWGFEEFRSLQLDIIESIMDGKDTLALLPTGGGKSICFQVPSLAKKGICIVVTPLIALMKDQTLQLKKRNISAFCLYSGQSWQEIDAILDRCIYDEVKFLYVAPERLKTEIFRERVQKMDVNLIAVDEAHCISQWGYDFRPSYLQIADLRKVLAGVPVLALTATATPEVANDIQEKLEFSERNIFTKSFARANLSYSCFQLEDKEHKLIQILKNTQGSAIVYVRSRKLTQKIAGILNRHDLNSGFYHAGLTHEERDRIQNSWINGTLRIIVATNAFGMGIDKSDVRCVIHLDIPENLESYYQEAGRAGRDGNKAYAVLLFHPADIETNSKKIEASYPEIPKLKRVYQALSNFYQLAEGSNAFSSFDFDIEEFSKNYQLNKQEIFIIFKIFEKENLVQFNTSFYDPSKIFFRLQGISLYEYQIAHQDHDNLIKIILRLYGGEAYSSFVTISEKKISNALNMEEKEVEKKLLTLNTNGVISYIKKKDKPQVTFLTPRLDASSLPIDIGSLLKRKKKEVEKNEAMLQYVLQESICRTVSIVTYFGEKNCTPCGICDICIRNKKKKIQINEEEYKQFILQKLKITPLPVNELLKAFINIEDEIIIIVRKLIDHQILEYNKEGKLSIKSKR